MAPKSPTGEMLAYVRENSPHLFETSVEEQVGLLEAASGAGAETAGGEAAGEEGEAASTDIALYRYDLLRQGSGMRPVSGETPTLLWTV